MELINPLIKGEVFELLKIILMRLETSLSGRDQRF